jgi:hypothetical protein
MHKIFIWSIQHTGTYFASYSIASAFPTNQQLRIGSLYERHQKLGHKRFTMTGPIELSDFTKPSKHVISSWIDQAVTTVCTPEELHNKRILVGHEHHHKARSWLIKSITAFKPDVKIIVPMRDPLLSLHSKLWRAREQHHNANWDKIGVRTTRANSWIERYIELLSIPKGHVFILPIDAEQSKSGDSRIELIQQAYEHCKVPFNDLAREAVKNWPTHNRTFDLIKKTQKNPPRPQWENFKKQYLAGDVEHTKAFMELEFEMLHKEDKLKKLMENVGYRDLLWW